MRDLLVGNSTSESSLLLERLDEGRTRNYIILLISVIRHVQVHSLTLLYRHTIFPPVDSFDILNLVN